VHHFKDLVELVQVFGMTYCDASGILNRLGNVYERVQALHEGVVLREVIEELLNVSKFIAYARLDNLPEVGKTKPVGALPPSAQ
jgi:hypothetical protein